MEMQTRMYRYFSIRFEARAKDAPQAIHNLWSTGAKEGPDGDLARLCVNQNSTEENPQYRYWQTPEGHYVFEAVVETTETAEQVFEVLRVKFEQLGWEMVGPP
jgi:hypothetical protein